MSTTTTGTTPTIPTTAAEIHAAAIVRATELAEGLDTWELSRLADCGTPGGDTEGADALRIARDVATEAAAECLAGLDPAEAVDLCAEAYGLHDATTDSVWEGVDGTAVLIYTSRTRAAFHELDGWEEDVSDWGTPEDLGQAATWAVFSIMRRCADAVVNTFATDYAEAVEDLGGLPEDDEDDTDD